MDTNGVADIFVHDRVTGSTGRVSVSSSGREGDGESGIVGVVATQPSAPMADSLLSLRTRRTW